jgi:uncharacterized cupredoxin-like copper-binding protein
MWKYRLFVLGITLVIACCASPSKVVTVPSGEQLVELKASSFDFDPNLIRARQGGLLVLVIDNVAGMEHNFTIKNPMGEVLVTKGLPAHETVQVEVPLSQTGEYLFYCDMPFHNALGMKGHLVVEK